MQINVILVSSEHVFPFRLADPRLGFNMDDITGYIFAGEIPPKSMLKLLTEEWKLSEAFALALIDIYGGHAYDVYLALSELRVKKERFIPFMASRTSNVAHCFKANLDVKLLVDTLKLLAETGFVPLEERDEPVAQVLSKNNVAGVVLASSLNVGLPDGVFKDGFKYGLVPSRQSMRLVIAEYLIDKQYI